MEPFLACIGGTAAYDLLRDGALLAKRLGPQSTPFGDSQSIYRCESRFGEFYFLSRHGESGFHLAPGFVNYRANIYALKELGVRSIISWSETRAISHNYALGEYVLVDDLIDETRTRPVTFFEDRGLGLVRQWPVFCPSMQQALRDTLAREDFAFNDNATYVCIEGPRRETPAEVRKYALYGGELLGTTLAPEVFLAKELQLCYASICYVAQYAETGSDFRPYENGRVLDDATQARRAQRAVEQFPRILERFSDVLPQSPCVCKCQSSMQHHIEAGQIDWDWKTWFDESTPPRSRRAELDASVNEYELYLDAMRAASEAERERFDYTDSTTDETRR